MLLAPLVFVLVACSSTNQAESVDDVQSSTAATAESPAAAFVEEVLGVVEDNAYYSDRIDWRMWREEGARIGAEAETIDDTYGFVRDLVSALEDGHSRFFTPAEIEQLTDPSTESPLDQRVPSGEVDAHGVGYLTLPGFQSFDMSSIEVANYLDAAFAVLDQSACGWIVDLTDNTGGTLFPMLSALAPILGSGAAVGYTDRDGSTDMYEITDDASLITNTDVELLAAPPGFPGFLHVDSPVAVLQGRQTASSGEGVLIALRGRGATTFGAPTAGVPTGNQFEPLTDGSAINLTTTVGTEPSGTRYDNDIEPDTEVSGTADDYRKQAAAWIADEPGCEHEGVTGQEPPAR